MRASTTSIPAMKIGLLIRTFCASLLIVAFTFATIPTGAGPAQGKAEKAFADWKAAQEAVAAAKAKLADAQKALQNAMTAVAKSGGKPNAAQEAALAQGRAAVAAAEAALREAEKQELAARVKLENEIAELPDGPLKDRLKRERNFPLMMNANGLHVIKFDTPSGQLVVNLPDDMRAGDTISGTVIAEPKGATAEERSRTQSELNGYVVEVLPPNQRSGTKVSTAKMFLPANFRVSVGDLPSNAGRGPGQPRLGVILMDKDGSPVQHAAEDVGPPLRAILAAGTNTFALPRLGQQGRRLEIPGPFDGNFDNTKVMVGGKEVPVLAESPRKAVFESPTNLTGPTEIVVKEGTTETKGEFRNVRVDLSAPKTNLMRGEQTVLKVEVSGLEGITNPVPLKLDATGVVTMDGGNSQSLRITPAEVNRAGTYTTTRSITGQQAGAFSVTATVIVDPATTQSESAVVADPMMSPDLESLREAEAAAQAAADKANQAAETAEQDARNVKAQADAAPKAVAEAVKDVNKAGAAVAEAEKERDRANREGTTAEREAARAALEKAQAELAAAQKALKDAQANARGNPQAAADEAAKKAAEKNAEADKAAADLAAAKAAVAEKEKEILKAQQEAAAAQAARDKEAQEARARAAAQAAADKAAQEKLWAEDIERRRQAQKNLDARAAEIDYLLDNIKKLGLITYRPKTNVPDPLDYVFDMLRQLTGQTVGDFLQTVAGEIGGGPIPGNVVGALGELAKSLGSFFDIRTKAGKDRALDKLQGMINPNVQPPRKYTMNEALAKIDKMEALMRELQKKLAAAQAAAGK